MSRDVLLQKDFSEDYYFFIDDDDVLLKTKISIMKLIFYIIALIAFVIGVYVTIQKDYQFAIVLMLATIAVLKLGEQSPRP